MNAELLFSGQTRVTARAVYVGQRLNLLTFEQGEVLAAAPLLIRAGANGAAALFRYGAVVAFGISAVEEAALLSALQPFISQPFEAMEAEAVELARSDETQDEIRGSTVLLADFSYERLQLVAYVLAKSVVLAQHEAGISDSFDRIEPLAHQLQTHGRGGRKARHLLRHIGETLAIQARMVGRVEVREKPELLWERPELERLYLRLEDEYELHERHVALERKLALVSNTAETLLELLHHQRSLRVEWYIVILIVIDIVISMVEKALS